MKLAMIGISVVAVGALAACGSSTSDSTSSASPSAPMSSPSASMSLSNIVGVASETADLTTLVTALDAAGLVSTLEGPGPFTVFAPTNAAFAALPAGVLDKLVQPQNKDALTKILTYHVVSGAVPAADVTTGNVATVEGQTIALNTAGGKVTVNGANVTTADVMASNGVVHIIDQVLLPPGFDPATLQ